MNFDDYLISKKIDAEAFGKAEPDVFKSWKMEFEQMHPNSFTVQKLNLINPIRRKYHLKEVQVSNVHEKLNDTPALSNTPSVAKPGKPVVRPKPKFN